MSDIDKAEELLKRTQTFLGSHESGGGYLTPTERSVLSDIREYFNKPVVIQDTFKNPVEVSFDHEGDVCFEWTNDYEEPISTRFIPREELLHGLREIGVIE